MIYWLNGTTYQLYNFPIVRAATVSINWAKDTIYSVQLISPNGNSMDAQITSHGQFVVEDSIRATGERIQ